MYLRCYKHLVSIYRIAAVIIAFLFYLLNMSLDCYYFLLSRLSLLFTHKNISLMTFTAFLDPYPFCLISGISSCSPSHILCFLQTVHIPQTCSPCMLFIGFLGIPQPSFKTHLFFITFTISPKLIILSQAPLLP